MSQEKPTDTIILEESLRRLSLAFDEFVGACMDDKGKPQAPTVKELMMARACLPPYCGSAFGKGER